MKRLFFAPILLLFFSQVSLAKEYSFSKNYFNEHTEKLFTEQLANFKDQPDVEYLELGVMEGKSLFWMLDNILTHQTSRATAVDVFSEKEIERTFRKNLKIYGQRSKVLVKKGLFSKVLPRLDGRKYDIIYLDGGHMPWTTLETTMLAWPLLKEGGILIFDDYQWAKGKYPPELRPQVAIDGFLGSFQNFMKVVHKGYAVVVKKIENPCTKAKCGEYACTGFVDYAYSWQCKSIFLVGTKKKRKLTEKQVIELENILMQKRSTAAGWVKSNINFSAENQSGEEKEK